MEKGLVEEINWLKTQAEKESCSEEDKKIFLRIANNYQYTNSRLKQVQSTLSWTNNPDQMGR